MNDFGTNTVTPTIDGNVDQWHANQMLFDKTVVGGGDPGPVVINAQPAQYRIQVDWGGYDNSNGVPTGDIQLLIGLDNPIGTTARHAPEPGDDDKTWRWNGSKVLTIPANERKRFSVRHQTGNGTAGNTFLRIQFIASA